MRQPQSVKAKMEGNQQRRTVSDSQWIKMLFFFIFWNLWYLSVLWNFLFDAFSLLIQVNFLAQTWLCIYLFQFFFLNLLEMTLFWVPHKMKLQAPRTRVCSRNFCWAWEAVLDIPVFSGLAPLPTGAFGIRAWFSFVERTMHWGGSSILFLD